MSQPTPPHLLSYAFSKKWMHWLLPFQIVTTGLLCWLLYRSIANTPDLGASWEHFIQSLSTQKWPAMVLAIALVAANWTLETAKWRTLLSAQHSISFIRAFTAVLAGISFSIVTPQRIGEYGGRLLLLPPEARWAGLRAKVVGNIAQVIILTGVGMPAALLLGVWAGLLNAPVAWALMVACVLLMGTVLYAYFSPKWIVNLLSAIRWPEWLKNRMTPFKALFEFPRQQLRQALTLALLRYLVYSTQYLLLLSVFDIEVSSLEGFVGIAAIFFGQTVLPLTALAGLAVRGNLAIWVWGLFGADAINSLSASLFLWILNLVLPALFGTLCVFRIQITKQKVL
jgi:uncharacterized membrane protein YbhN (UPF0104 family)